MVSCLPGKIYHVVLFSTYVSVNMVYWYRILIFDHFYSKPWYHKRGKKIVIEFLYSISLDVGFRHVIF